jgi:thiamine pyrophosphokinase
MSARSSRTIVVVTGGDPLDPAQLPELPAGALVVAADSGIDRAHALGLAVDVAVGDFDSVSGTGLARAEAGGAAVDRHPEAKDATDLELALEAALAHGPEHVILLGGHGGRLDHLLVNALLLAAPALADVRVTAQMGAARIDVVRPPHPVELHGAAGDLVSLVPVHGPAVAVRTAGLLYPLVDEDLPVGSTRGVSNELVAARAAVSLREGVLLAVRPGARGTHHQRNLR